MAIVSVDLKNHHFGALVATLGICLWSQKSLPLTGDNERQRGDGGTTVFVLVRHAQAGNKKAWAGDDHQRPLSEAGRQQADGLAQSLLGLMEPAALLASPYVRCQQTLVVMAKRSGLLVQPRPFLSPDAPPEDLDRYLASAESDLSVLCTHGEVLKLLMSRWTGRGTQWLVDGEPTTGRKTEKGAAWLVLTDGSQVAHYIRPLHVGPALQAEYG